MEFIITLLQVGYEMLIKNSFHYPAMLKLQDKPCVIIGGGSVAARKLGTLAAAGAQVTVIAPAFSEELLHMAEQHPCKLVQAVYEPHYLAEAFVVIAATDSREINRQITAAAPCLCNNITEPELSNFIVPSSFTRGDITVALATGGMPAFTRLLKQHLQQQLTPELADFNAFLQEQRDAVRHIPSTPKERTAFWRGVLDEALLNTVTAGHSSQAKEKILDAVNSFRSQSQNSTR